MTDIKDIVDSIENRLRALHEEIGILDAAHAALIGHDSAAPGSRPRLARREAVAGTRKNGDRVPAADAAVELGGAEPAEPIGARAPEPRRSAGRRLRARGRRSAAVVPSTKLEQLLADTDGLATSALAERANADRDQVLALLRQLETAGRVRRTGQRRATRWHTITDEDRIQERAAQLAAQSRSAA
jgi:hypothetical protein